MCFLGGSVLDLVFVRVIISEYVLCVCFCRACERVSLFIRVCVSVYVCVCCLGFLARSTCE